MPEIVDNGLQLSGSLLGCIFSGILYVRSRRQSYFILNCFYGSFTLANLYWLLYTILITDAPPMFYVSEIGWTAGYFFLILLQDSLCRPEERTFRCRAMWIAPLVIVPLTVYYITIGTVIYNLIIGGIMLVIFRSSLRGFFYWRKQKGKERNLRLFHLTVMAFVILENGLWLSSYPWRGDGWSNPYFWIDFAVTAVTFSLLPAVRKAVNV